VVHSKFAESWLAEAVPLGRFLFTTGIATAALWRVNSGSIFVTERLGKRAA